MKATEIIEKLRLQFNELIKQSNPVALVSATLKDGTAVEVTDLTVGGIVTIDGNPAPVGEHELSDGTIIVVGDNGAITEIKPAQQMPEEPPMQEDMTAKFSAFELSTNEKFSSYESKFASYEQKFADYEAKLNKATQMIGGLLNFTQTLAETPTGKPDEAVKTSNNFVAEKKEKNYDLLFS
jgi:uncharacterized short protein YbdD (DUF466 family)